MKNLRSKPATKLTRVASASQKLSARTASHERTQFVDQMAKKLNRDPAIAWSIDAEPFGSPP